MISSLVNVRRVMPAAAARLLDQREDLGIGNRFPVVAVAVPAAPGLLPEPPHLAQLVRDQRLARAGFGKLIELLPHPPRDVHAGHVVHGEDAHRHAEVGQRAIDLLGRRAILDEKLRFVHVGEHHPVADEPRRVSGDDADLAEALGDRQRRGQRPRGRGRAADDLQQPHHVRGAEEVEPDDLLRPLRHRGDLIDVERGGVRGEDRVRLRCQHRASGRSPS